MKYSKIFLPSIFFALTACGGGSGDGDGDGQANPMDTTPPDNPVTETEEPVTESNPPTGTGQPLIELPEGNGQELVFYIRGQTLGYGLGEFLNEERASIPPQFHNSFQDDQIYALFTDAQRTSENIRVVCPLDGVQPQIVGDDFDEVTNNAVIQRMVPLGYQKYTECIQGKMPPNITLQFATLSIENCTNAPPVGPTCDFVYKGPGLFSEIGTVTYPTSRLDTFTLIAEDWNLATGNATR